MIKRLEKQLEFEFMKKEEKSRRRFELMDSLVGPLAESLMLIGGLGMIGGLGFLDEYLNKHPNIDNATNNTLSPYFRAIEEYIKEIGSLFY